MILLAVCDTKKQAGTNARQDGSSGESYKSALRCSAFIVHFLVANYYYIFLSQMQNEHCYNVTHFLILGGIFK